MTNGKNQEKCCEKRMDSLEKHQKNAAKDHMQLEDYMV